MSTNSPHSAAQHGFTLATYKGQEAPFYIQSRGEHTGRPMRQPITNCLAVTTDREDLYALAEVVYRAGHYRRELIGSVIPFLPIASITRILGAAVERHTPATDKLLDAIAQAVALRDNYAARLDRMEQVIGALCAKAAGTTN